MDIENFQATPIQKLSENQYNNIYIKRDDLFFSLLEAIKLGKQSYFLKI